MKVSNKKRSLPGPIRMALLCVQHLCAAFMVVMLVYMALSIGVVGEGIPDGSHYYGLNPFEKTEKFEESNTFSEIFKDYAKKAVLDTVISSQFGTTGEIDGETPIDIVAYANRKNKIETSSTYNVTYKLDDLLKWGMYGITYQTYNIESLDDIFAMFPEMEAERELWSYEDALDSVYEAAIINNVDYRTYFKENTICIAMSIPVERYEPVPVGGNSSLKEISKNWTEYCFFISKLKSTVEDLSINFETYQKLHKNMLSDATNFRYCIEVQDEKGQTMTFTNLSLSNGGKDYLTKTAGPVYFIWDRSGILYDSNMSVEIYEYIRDLVSEFEYALGEEGQIYFSVEGTYPAQDAFRMGIEKYVITKDIWFYVGIAICCALVWLILFLYLSVMAGRKKVDGETQIVLSWFDYVPTEIAVAICVAAGAGVILLLQELAYSFGDFMTWYTYEEDELMLLIFALVASGLSILFSFFWHSMLRRLKARTVLRHSFIYRFLAWGFKGIKKGVNAVKVQIQYIYNNSSNASKVMWPFVLLVLIHFIVVPVAGVLVVEGMQYGNGAAVLGLAIYGILFVMDFMVAMAILKNKVVRTEIIKHIERIAHGEMDIRLEESQYKGENQRLAASVNNIGNGIKTAVETSMKDERMKADLITNVSHDIKTPLTSIINYVDLLKREQIETEPIKGYIEVLDAKSQRLKQLTDDLVEASKISSGNIVLHMESLNLAELLKQSVGEFSERFEEKRLTIVENYGDGESLIYADPRRMWRVIENLFNNIYKYALEGTRVYIDITKNTFGEKNQILLSVKNISAGQLSVRPDELTERFVRGDDSRTTEGSGLGLSIAKSLVEAQGGQLNIILDGDLFKIVVLFEESVHTSSFE